MSATRVRELEKAEVDGTIRLSDLNRIAEALNCTVFYALLPKQSLEETVWRQAHRKAIRELEANDLVDPGLDDPFQRALARRVRLEELTLHFVDHHKLWSESPDPTTGSFDGTDDGTDDSAENRTDHSEPHRR